jgi:predicted HicB family RNase H-like nuclease
MTDAERYGITVRRVLVDGEELWRATVKELPDLAEFAETREEAVDLALDAIESLKKAAQEDGRPFPEPIEDEEEYSGRVTLRMSKSMHRAAALRAIDEKVSLNSYIVECIAMRSAVAVSLEALPIYSQAQGYVVGVADFSDVIITSLAGPMPDEGAQIAHVAGQQIAIGTATQYPRVPVYMLEKQRRTA